MPLDMTLLDYLTTSPEACLFESSDHFVGEVQQSRRRLNVHAQMLTYSKNSESLVILLEVAWQSSSHTSPPFNIGHRNMIYAQLRDDSCRDSLWGDHIRGVIFAPNPAFENNAVDLFPQENVPGEKRHETEEEGFGVRPIGVRNSLSFLLSRVGQSLPKLKESICE
ncbi:hypothetical protein HG531_002069 [Fusarium graminearum]|nr:hypothetical protein HG531_002069 [Fusarium graminearum]